MRSIEVFSDYEQLSQAVAECFVQESREAIDEEFVANNPVCTERFDDDFDERVPNEVRHGFTEQESELIAQRLQALGYIQ